MRDSGTGIAPEHLSKIFDPFFSTRSNGTGLGLAISYSIIRKHDGVIRVDSRPGAGSTFTIYLPVSPQAATPGASHGRNPRRARVRAGGCLFMDDDPDIRDLGGRDPGLDRLRGDPDERGRGNADRLPERAGGRVSPSRP